MDKYPQFTSAEQIEQQAADWLARIDSDQPLSASEDAQLKQWLQRSPAHRVEFKRLARFWQQANALTELSIPLPSQPASGRNWFAWPRLAVAASLVIALALGFNLGFNQPPVSGNGIYETRIGEQNSITLVDGSVIELNTHSRLQVNYTDQRRSIQLMRGEAYFSVSKDSTRPFEVAAGDGLVRAVGTAFAVRMNPQALTVTVTEGKVALVADSLKTDNPGQGGQAAPLGALIAGQRVNFAPKLAQVLADQTETLAADVIEDALAWRKGLLKFNGEPLAEVVDEMNRYTALTIEIADPSIAAIQVGGQFKVSDTDAMLKNLAVSFQLDIRRVSPQRVQLYRKK